jgi:hypothetical protein
MEPVLVCSPHLDDAVLSAGEFLASWPGARVLTVFAGAPSPPVITTFDLNSGFSDSDMAMTSRFDEDDRALAELKSIPMRAAFLDNQYRTDPIEDEALAVISKGMLLARSSKRASSSRSLISSGVGSAMLLSPPS